MRPTDPAFQAAVPGWLADLIDSYGAKPARWPDAARARLAAADAQTQAAARLALRQAAAFEQLIVADLESSAAQGVDAARLAGLSARVMSALDSEASAAGGAGGRVVAFPSRAGAVPSPAIARHAAAEPVPAPAAPARRGRHTLDDAASGLGFGAGLALAASLALGILAGLGGLADRLIEPYSPLIGVAATGNTGARQAARVSLEAEGQALAFGMINESGDYEGSRL